MDISPDGRDTACWGDRAPSPGGAFSLDMVPYALAPSYGCDLRMQVGGLVLGDLDNDQDPDLAVGCYRSQSYPPYPDWRNFVLYNQGGQLQTVPGWWSGDSTSTTDVRIADFNRDQHPDLYAGNGDASLTPDAIYFGLAGDSLSRLPGWTAANSTWTTGVAVCDFDHDNDVDVATSNQAVSPDPYRPVSIFRNNNGVLEQYPSWTSLAGEISSALAWSDVTGDGFEDLAVSKWVNFYSCVYRNNQGTVERSPFWTGNTAQGQKGIALADANGDSLPDAAVGGSIPTQLYLNTGNTLGTAPSWQSRNPYHGTQDIAWADVDADGDPDLATVEFSTGHFRIYLNRAGRLDSVPSWQYDSPGAGTALAFGDINGDGFTDLVAGVSGQPCVAVFLNTMVAGVGRETPPASVRLAGSYPNPFNSSTTILFETDRREWVRMDILDVLGRRVDTPVLGEFPAGRHRAVWTGTDGGGVRLCSGTYLCRLTTGASAAVTRLLLLR